MTTLVMMKNITQTIKQEAVINRLLLDCSETVFTVHVIISSSSVSPSQVPREVQ